VTASSVVSATAIRGTPFVRALRNRVGDIALSVASGTAILLVLAILVIILGDVVIHGSARLSLRFFFTAPEQGMTEGGIFPALFGTVAMVLLMTIAGFIHARVTPKTIAFAPVEEERKKALTNA